MYCQKEEYRDSKRYWYPPLGFVVPSITYFRSMYGKLAENPRCAFEKQRRIFAKMRCTVTVSISPSWCCCALHNLFSFNIP